MTRLQPLSKLGSFADWLGIAMLILQLGCDNAATRTEPEPRADQQTAMQPATAAPSPAEATPAVDVANVEVKNPSGTARSSETIGVALADLTKLGVEAKQAIVVDAAGKPVLSQLVDNDGDDAMDELIFQTDLRANESKRFAVRKGTRSLAPRDAYKVYGRFVRERHDDFAWENDRFARRMYGLDLETWAKEPLVSSGIDSWSKRTSRLVVNDWYLTDDYHHDNGEGADLYSVGKSRGCGGLGVWSGDALHVSRNFVKTRVFANGPIRLIFELEYPEWSVGAQKISETKRVTLDAGKSFERHENTFKVTPAQPPVQIALGIAKHKDSALNVDKAGHWMRAWEPMSDGSHAGCAVVLPPPAAGEPKQSELDYLLVTNLDASGKLRYHPGFGWDRGGSGAVSDSNAWDTEVQTLARELGEPVSVTLAAAQAAKP